MIGSDSLVTLLIIAIIAVTLLVIVLVAMAVVSPLLSNKTLAEDNREARNMHNKRVADMERRIEALETSKNELMAKNLELTIRNGEMANMLKQASDEIVRLQQKADEDKDKYNQEIVRLQEQIWELQDKKPEHDPKSIDS